MKTEKIRAFIAKCFSWLWRKLSNNLGWKILSVLVALLLWSYIISADSSITQMKTLANVDVITTGLTVLQSRDLALLTDTSSLEDIHVRVDASQSNYARVTNDTVHVELDLSQVTSAGVQEIELTGVTTYGKVVQITPSSVEVVIETLASRYVPVNAEFTGDLSENYWYNIARINPTQVTVSGPSSIVRSIGSALAQVNPADRTSSYLRSVQLTLLGENGEPITNGLARPSITEAMVNVEIYPRQQFSVSDSPETATIGALPEGYQIKSIDVEPDMITVAADPSLLSELTGMSFEPVDITGRTGSFTAVAALNRLKDIKYMSSEQVSVTVYIEEMEATVTLTDIPVTARGVQAGRSVSFSSENVTVRVTGPYTIVNSLEAEDIQAWVDVAGLEEGKSELPVALASDVSGDLTLECAPSQLTVVISEARGD